jgi:hypothetical protein
MAPMHGGDQLGLTPMGVGEHAELIIAGGPSKAACIPPHVRLQAGLIKSCDDDPSEAGPSRHDRRHHRRYELPAIEKSYARSSMAFITADPGVRSGNTCTIVLTASIQLSGNLPALNLPSDENVVINGAGFTIAGCGTYRAVRAVDHLN